MSHVRTSTHHSLLSLIWVLVAQWLERIRLTGDQKACGFDSRLGLRNIFFSEFALKANKLLLNNEAAWTLNSMRVKKLSIIHTFIDVWFCKTLPCKKHENCKESVLVEHHKHLARMDQILRTESFWCECLWILNCLNVRSFYMLCKLDNFPSLVLFPVIFR